MGPSANSTAAGLMSSFVSNGNERLGKMGGSVCLRFDIQVVIVNRAKEPFNIKEPKHRVGASRFARLRDYAG